MITDKFLIETLIREYGSPLYVFDKEKFIHNYRYFENCMKSEYDKYQLSYSFKTNYAPYICKLILEMGGYAEVVSDMEYYIAKKAGFSDGHIIYNGPIKGNLGNEMLLNGGMLNVDSLEELKRIADLANGHKDKVLKIGLRLNVDVGQSFVSRFGIDADSKDLDKALAVVNTTDNLVVQGLHCHVGQSRTIVSWKNRAVTMLDIADSYFKDKKLKYIDLGSGMYGEMDESLSIQFGGRPGGDLPVYEEYAAAVGKVFSEHYSGYSFEEKPILFTEPGTTIINYYIDFIGMVSSIKHIRGKDFIVLDCSKHNLGEISTLKKLPVHIIHKGGTTEEIHEGAFVGYTCLEHDVMYKDYNGELAVGDYVVFGNVGGYSNVNKPPFILPNCTMVSVEGGKVEVIKRKETFDDVIRTYMI